MAGSISLWFSQVPMGWTPHLNQSVYWISRRNKGRCFTEEKGEKAIEREEKKRLKRLQENLRACKGTLKKKKHKHKEFRSSGPYSDLEWKDMRHKTLQMEKSNMLAVSSCS